MSDLPKIINYKKATQLTDLGSFNLRKDLLNLIRNQEIAQKHLDAQGILKLFDDQINTKIIY